MLELYNTLNEVADVSARTGKEKLLKELKGNANAEYLLQMAYDPFITFGLANVELPEDNYMEYTTDEVAFDNIVNLLHLLSERQLTGKAAREAVEEFFETHTRYQSELLVMILKKDLRAGFSSSTLNKVFGKDFITKFETMLAHKYDAERVRKFPVTVEPKLDGMRCIARVQDGQVEFLSRNGKTITSIPHLEKEISSVVGKETRYIDGELTSGDNFNVSISALRKKDEVASNAIFHVFDVLEESEFLGRKDTIFDDRKDRIKAFNHCDNIKPISRYIANSDEEVLDYYARFFERGFEGIIVKQDDGIYEPKRSYNWMKIKDCNDADLEVVGFFEGEGKYEGKLGGLIVDFNGVEVRVGSGLSDIQRQDIWEQREALIGIIAEVQYHEVTPDGSLRHPRFVRFRDDKS